MRRRDDTAVGGECDLARSRAQDARDAMARDAKRECKHRKHAHRAVGVVHRACNRATEARAVQYEWAQCDSLRHAGRGKGAASGFEGPFLSLPLVST